MFPCMTHSKKDQVHFVDTFWSKSKWHTERRGDSDDEARINDWLASEGGGDAVHFTIDALKVLLSDVWIRGEKRD